MLADKSGLRKKPTGKKPSKFTAEDLEKINRQAGLDLEEQMFKEGKLTEKQRANYIRKKLEKEKSNG